MTALLRIIKRQKAEALLRVSQETGMFWPFVCYKSQHVVHALKSTENSDESDNIIYIFYRHSVLEHLCSVVQLLDNEKKKREG